MARSCSGYRTAFARPDGRRVGVLANNPEHLGGAIDGDAADTRDLPARTLDHVP